MPNGEVWTEEDFARIKDPELEQQMRGQAKKREVAERADKRSYKEIKRKDVPFKRPPRGQRHIKRGRRRPYL